MTVEESLSKWSDACSVIKCGEALVRDGNWQPLARALRHFTAEGAATIEEAEDKLNGDTVLLVTPAKPEGDPPPGKTHQNRPPFLLLVR